MSSYSNVVDQFTVHMGWGERQCVRSKAARNDRIIWTGNSRNKTKKCISISSAVVGYLLVCGGAGEWAVIQLQPKLEWIVEREAQNCPERNFAYIYLLVTYVCAHSRQMLRVFNSEWHFTSYVVGVVNVAANEIYWFATLLVIFIRRTRHIVLYCRLLHQFDAIKCFERCASVEHWRQNEWMNDTNRTNRMNDLQHASHILYVEYGLWSVCESIIEQWAYDECVMCQCCLVIVEWTVVSA